MANTNPNIKITADTVEAELALKKFGSAVTGLEGRMGSMIGVAGLLGGALSIASFGRFISGSIDAADHMNDLSKSTSLSVEQLSGLKLAAAQTGTNLDSVSGLIGKFSKKLGENGDAFAKIGINAKDPLKALEQLSDIFVSINDPQQKAAFAAKALGKTWQEMAPMLAEGGAGIAAMVEKGQKLSRMTGEIADRADAFKDTMAELDMQFGAVGTSIAGKMLPQLQNLSTAFTNLTQNSPAFDHFSEGVAGGLNLIVQSAAGVVYWLSQSSDSIGALAAASVSFFTRFQSGKEERKAIWSEHAKNAEEARDKFSKFISDLDKPPVLKTKPSVGDTKKPTGAALHNFIDDGKDANESAKIAAELKRNKDKFDKLREMAEIHAATAQQKIDLRLQADINGYKVERDLAISHKAWNTELDAKFDEAVKSRRAQADEEKSKLIEKQNVQELKLKQDHQAALDDLNATILQNRIDDPAVNDTERMALQLALAQAQEDAQYQQKMDGINRETEALANNNELTVQMAIEQAQRLELIEQAHQERKAGLKFKYETDAQRFTDTLRSGDYKSALAHGANMTAGLAQHSRAFFEINKALSKANIAVNLPSAVIKSFEAGGGFPWGLIPAGLMLAQGASQLAAVNGTTFGGGVSVPSSLGGGGASSLPSALSSSSSNSAPQLPSQVTAAPAPQNINLTISGLSTIQPGDLVSATMVRDQLIPQIISGLKDGVGGANINLVYQ